MSKLIEAKNLTFSYTGSPPFVLDGINLKIEDGNYVSVLGENGCGKSTLMRLILRFLKPTSGTSLCKANRIGYVPQKNDFSNPDFPITVYEMLDSYRQLLKIHDKDAVKKSLALVGMEDYKKALMGSLSGGQGQKIRIARATLGRPELLVLDEPSTGVDFASRKDIYGFLTRANRKYGITVVSVEHNLEAAIESSTLIYHLDHGKGHLCTPQKYAEEFLEPEKGGRH
ncbi:MAG TPA: metal ABC transporter ATP-binding protein [Clostridia bacterium]|nr:metal ABC transporter ATP-binding protein [Clostridia bacterium]